MGCFNHKANFSQLPVRYGDRAVVIIGVSPVAPMPSSESFSPGHSFTPISVPIRGIYNDYGGLEKVDKTPGVEALEKFFEMDVESIIDATERICCGCDEPTEKVREAITKLMNIYKSNPFHSEDQVHLSYIMEHESIFDYLVNMSNVSIADRSHWQIPQEYLVALGYSEKNRHKHDGYDDIIWIHNTLPKLHEQCYVWKAEEFGDFGKVVHTLRELCAVIGCEVPEEFNASFYEDCFKKDMDAIHSVDIESEKTKYMHLVAENKITEEKLDEMVEMLTSHDSGNKMYSFIRKSFNHGLFSFRDGLYFNELILGTMGRDNEHLKPEYMDDVVAITCLMDSMSALEMTWGVTNYYRQDVNYDQHIGFLQKCLDVAMDKKKESTEE